VRGVHGGPALRSAGAVLPRALCGPCAADLVRRGFPACRAAVEWCEEGAF
jgi:hypothetical protein